MECARPAVCRVGGARTGPDSGVGVEGRAGGRGRCGSWCVAPGGDLRMRARPRRCRGSGVKVRTVGRSPQAHVESCPRVSPLGPGLSPARSARDPARPATYRRAATSHSGSRPPPMRTPTPQPRQRRARARIRRLPRGATEQDPRRPRRQHERQCRHQNRARCANHRPDTLPPTRTLMASPNSGFALPTPDLRYIVAKVAAPETPDPART